MTDRRAFLTVAASGLLAASVAAAQPGKPARIGRLQAGSDLPPEFEGFHEGLRELGHVEGRTYVIELRYVGDPARYRELVAEMARSQVDIIVTNGPIAAAVKAVAPGVPVVFLSNDPIAEGLVTSFNRPGGNLTGIAIPLQDLAAKSLELVREVVPGVRRIAVLAHASSTGKVLAAFRAAAAVQKIGLVPVTVRGASDLETAFATAARRRAGAITLEAHPLFDSQRPLMVTQAARYRLPAVYYQRRWAETGGLMAYGPDFRHIFCRFAVYVDRILKGARPADLPVEQPTKFELVVNLRTAKALGLTFPQSILIRADDVIE